ncbi:MAG: ABC transporter permease [Desulfurococcaceae archaeon]
MKSESSRLYEIYSGLYANLVFFFRILWRRKRALVGFLILLIVYVIPAILVVTRVIPRLPPARGGWENMYRPPSLDDFPWYILGTESTGRPLLLCLLHGIPPALSIAFLAGIITVGVGLVIGLSAGYIGGWVDAGLVVVIDVAQSIPALFLSLILSATLPTELKGNPLIIAGVLSITAWAGLARAVRAQVFSLKRREVIEVAKVLGFSTWKIIFGEIMRYIMPFIFMSLIGAVVGSIGGYFGLAFLGLFPLDPTNWSWQISRALDYLGALGLIRGGRAQLGFWAPTVMIILLQTSLIYLSEIVEELFNPILRVMIIRELETKKVRSK